MAIIGFIAVMLAALLLVVWGVLMTVVAKAFSGNSECYYFLLISALGMVLGYYGLTNSPFEYTG